MAEKWYGHRCQEVGDRRYMTGVRITHAIVLLEELAHVGVEGVDRGVHSGVEGDQEFGLSRVLTSIHFGDV